MRIYIMHLEDHRGACYLKAFASPDLMRSHLTKVNCTEIELATFDRLVSAQAEFGIFHKQPLSPQGLYYFSIVDVEEVRRIAGATGASPLAISAVYRPLT